MASAVATQQGPFGSVADARDGKPPASRATRVRVLLVDDHPIFRLGLQRVLAEQGDIDVVGEAANGREAIALAGVLRPDVVVCDLDLPIVPGRDVAQNLRQQQPAPAVILMGQADSADQLVEAVQVGAAGFYRKDVAADELAEGIRRASAGEYVIDERVVDHPALARRLLQQLRDLGAARESEPPVIPLSTREIEVLDLIARGKSNKEIARLLTISDQTVKNHISSILRKLAVNDRTQAVVYAIRRGWISVVGDEVASGDATSLSPRLAPPAWSRDAGDAARAVYPASRGSRFGHVA